MGLKHFRLNRALPPGLGIGILVTVLVTSLFAEWMWPLVALTDTYTVYPFLLLFAVVFILQLIRCPIYVSFPVVGLLLLYLTHQLHFAGLFLNVEWLFLLLDQLLQSIPIMFSWRWTELSVTVRTFLFLNLIWLIALSLYQNIFVRRRILFFVVMTLGYVAVLDTFTPYSGKLAVVRAMAAGFALLALLQWQNLERHTVTTRANAVRAERVRTGSGGWRWAAVSLGLILMVVGGAYAAPKAAPSWPDPVSFLQGGGQGDRTQETINKVGYGSSDERLGGPFQPDDTVVFEAITPKLTYWRGESRDVYTGQGWERSEGMEWTFSFEHFNEAREFMEVPLVSEEVTTEEHLVDVRYYHPSRGQVFYPGDPIEIEVRTDEEVVGAWERMSGRLMVYQRDNQRKQVIPAGYSLSSAFPIYSEEKLREAKLDDVPDEILTRYTQLPDSLPERVRNLAKEAVEGQETMYDQVRTLESYFKMNGFRYETQNVPVPEPGQDYVDQFLFETQQGYCDNFSTAMVVMLRSLDIPARWVKGFTSGEIQERSAEAFRVAVQNNHAHSWVEVYFPGTGWVPFEPTNTFQNPAQFERERQAENDHESPVTPEMDTPSASLEELQEAMANDPVFSGWNEPFGKRVSYIGWLLTIIGILIALVVIFRIILWRRLLLTWAILRFKRSERPSLIPLYHFLIYYLGRFVKPKEPSQTLSEYVASLEKVMAVDKLKPLTQSYEELRFGKREHSPRHRQHLYRLWIDLIRELRSYHNLKSKRGREDHG